MVQLLFVRNHVQSLSVGKYYSISVGGGRGLLCHGGGSAIQEGVALSQEVTLYMEIPPPVKRIRHALNRAIIDRFWKGTTFTYRWFSSPMFSVFAAFC